MNQGKYIFAQLTDFLPRRVFDRLLEKYSGNKKIRTFTCWNQIQCMIFGQLTARDSIRDLMLSLEAHKNKYYHLGLGSTVTRTNRGKANRNIDYRIYEEFAYALIAEARNSYYTNDFEVEVNGNVYAFDSSTIDLCLNVFWWAEFRKYKGGIKLHILYDVKTSIPTIVLITNAKVHGVNMLDELNYEKRSFYIMDKGYVDFTRLHKFHTSGAYFVTRAKDNMRFRRMYSREIDKTTGIKCDQIGMLETYKSLKAYSDKLRWVKYYDEQLDREFVFITNNMELSAEEIALLYNTGLEKQFMENITVTPAEIIIPAGQVESEKITWSITDDFLLSTSEPKEHTLVVTASVESEDPVVVMNEEKNTLTFNVNKVFQNFYYVTRTAVEWIELDKTDWSADLDPTVKSGQASYLIDGLTNQYIFNSKTMWFVIDM